MESIVTRDFEDQLMRIVLALVLLTIGVAQLFFANQIRDRLLLLRQYLQRVYAHHPMLSKLFGPPLRMTVLRGYTVRKRIIGAILLLSSVVLFISAFQSPDPCEEDFWRMTKREGC
jgi:hypothetical protein